VRNWFQAFAFSHFQFVLLRRGEPAEGDVLPHAGDHHPRGDGGEVLINRSTAQVKPFYRSSETVLPMK
jgi:hypothetical protein